MTEDEARQRVEGIVGRAATERLARFATLVGAENDRQNLVARSTLGAIWSRHILDSVQLITLGEPEHGSWLDIGTGGGFPGMAIAIACRRPIFLCESRRRRAEFLVQATEELGLAHASVVSNRVEHVVAGDVSTISARAVAPIATLFGMAGHLAGLETRWLMPRGARWQNDLEGAKQAWQATFHVEQSVSDPTARIVVATGVIRR